MAMYLGPGGYLLQRKHNELIDAIRENDNRENRDAFIAFCTHIRESHLEYERQQQQRDQ